MHVLLVQTFFCTLRLLELAFKKITVIQSLQDKLRSDDLSTIIILTYESVDEILPCYHSYENQKVELLHSAFFYEGIQKRNAECIENFILVPCYEGYKGQLHAWWKILYFTTNKSLLTLEHQSINKLDWTMNKSRKTEML